MQFDKYLWFWWLKMKSAKYFSLIFTVMMSTCLANEELDEFVKLFQQKRLVQLSAIKQLLNMNPTRCLIYKCTNFWRSCLSSYLNVQISSVFRVISFFQKSFESSKCLFYIHFGLLFASKYAYFWQTWLWYIFLLAHKTSY